MALARWPTWPALNRPTLPVLAARHPGVLRNARRGGAGRAVRLWAIAAVLALAWIAAGSGVGAARAEPRGELLIAQLGPGGAPGIVKTVAYASLTPGLAIAVKPYQDDDFNLAVKQRFEEELGRISRSVSETAVLVLSFETKVVAGEFSVQPGTMGRFEADTGSAQLNLNVWSSTQDSLLGGRQQAETRRGNVFHMNVTLRDNRSGKTLWQGDAYCMMLTGDRLRIARSMVRPLVTSLGRTVGGDPFEIE